MEAPFFPSSRVLKTDFIFQYLFGMIYSEQSQHQTKLWIFTTRHSYNAIPMSLENQSLISTSSSHNLGDGGPSILIF